MKLSDLIGSAPNLLGEVTLRAATPHTSESAAQIAGTVRLSVWAETGRDTWGRPHVTRGDATATWDGSTWRRTADATYARYTGRETSILFGAPRVDHVAVVCDFEIEVDGPVHRALLEAIQRDRDDAAEAVVWRPRPNEYVVRILMAGDHQSGRVLMPDGSERVFADTRSAWAIFMHCEGVSRDNDLRDRLANGTPGRSEVDRSATSGLYTRVCGHAAFRALRRGEAIHIAKCRVDPAEWRAVQIADAAIACGDYINC